MLLSGRNVGYLPIEMRGWQGKLMFPLIWWVWEHILTERLAGRGARSRPRSSRATVSS